MNENINSRKNIEIFYSKAAEKPRPELCCPVTYSPEYTSHVPSDVIDRFYGCGSPVIMAEIKNGDTILDLGSGAGIDCFVASKITGPSGHVIGIDMTDKMLEIAESCKSEVVRNLGYDNVEFRKGFLENIPVDDLSVDLITSNCVINLSPYKMKVFTEMWRILKNDGTITISDIVSDRILPEYITTNMQLMGECIGGVLTEEKLINYLNKAGFHGLSIISRTLWKIVDEFKFYSLTIRGYKFIKSDKCHYKGQTATYLGPFTSVNDEDGHKFIKGIPVEICTDTAYKLSRPPYENNFYISGNANDISAQQVCCDNSACCS